MRYKITVEYFGEKFRGWQKHIGFPSIQESLELAIANFSKSSVAVFGSGRTDSGVHALGQVAHFDIETTMQTYSILKAINYHLWPKKIKVLDISETDSNFHARFSAIQRHYEYKIINRSVPLTIDAGRAWQVKQSLNVEQMKIHSSALVGYNDLTSFRDKQCQAKIPMRTISNINITKTNDLIKIFISAQSFLHKQVRIIVGTLVESNIKQKPDNHILNVIQQKNRSSAGITAPPDGLYLVKVDY